VVQVTPVVEAPVMVIGPNQTGAGIVRGMAPSDVRATRLVAGNIKAGSLNGYGKGEYGGDIILAGASLAENMGVSAGDALTLVSAGSATVFGTAPNRKPYTVGGVFGTGMSQYDSAFIYMPLEQAQLFLGRGPNVDVVEVNIDNPDRLDQLKPAIAQAAGPAAIVRDWRDQNHSFWNALQVEKSVMRLILMLIVAIAAANIISGLVMLVKNKGRDIAILRTMGASRGAILRVFFLSGAMIGVAATLTGLVLGALFCTFIGPIQSFVEWATGVTVFSPDTYYLSRIPARMELREVAIVTFWSLVMSFVATLPPAFRASRLDPVEALRYE
jgi:lipoprotein-releasing system permease protein